MTFSYPFVETSTAADWGEWDRYGVTVTGDGRLVLATDPVPSFAPAASLGEDLVDRSIQDVALDECGELTVLTTTGEVFQYDENRQTATRLACLPDDTEAFAEPRALSFAADSLYVAHGPTGSPRLHAFSRHLLQRRWSLEEGFEDPVALLERDRRLHVLDRGVPADSSDDADADATPGFVATVDETGRVDVVHRGLGDVVDFATDDRGWLYVLVRTDDEGENENGNGGAETGPTYAVRAFDDHDEAAADEWPGVPPEAFPHRGADPLPLSCLDASIDRSLCVGVAALPGEGGGVYRYPFGTVDGADGADDATGADGDATDGDGTDDSDDAVAAQSTFTRLPTLTVGTAGLLLDERWSEADGPHVEATAYVIRSPPAESTDVDRRVLSYARTRRNLPSRGGPGRFAGRAVKRFDADALETVWHRVQAVVSSTEPGTQVRFRYVALDTPAATGADEGDEADRADDDGAVRPGRGSSAVSTPAPPEGFERIPTLSPAVAARLREANVLGVAGLADLSAEAVLDVLEPLSEPVSYTTVREWIRAAQTLTAQWTPVETTPPTDVLLDEAAATGQSLWVELQLLGDEFASPAVDSVRAYFPRQSYLQYLPTIYREDPRSAEFLMRFLSLFESTYVGLEAEFAGLSRYFDATGVPEAHLGWLAEWVGVSLDEVWSEETRREVLRRAPHLAARRGTREGVTLLLETLLADVAERSLSWTAARERERETLDALASEGFVDDVDAALAAHDALAAEYTPFVDERVRVWEYDDFDCVDTDGARATFRDVLRCPQCFVVLVRAAATDDQWRALRRTVTAQTPAHAVGDVVEVRSRIEVGAHTYLGVNSVVADDQFLVDATSLGRETTLTEREPRGQLDVGARLGTDARLS
jgi:phage tail-like protein